MPFADSEYSRLTAGYLLALLLVTGLHALGWWWTHHPRVVAVTPAVVPQMVDVELMAAEPEAPPAPTPPTKVTPPKPPEAKPKPVVKPVVKPVPKPVEPRPKAKPTSASDEVDDLAQRLKHLRESLGNESAPAKASAARSAAKASESRAASSAKTTTARADHLHNPKPPYPAVARARNWEGTSHLRVYVLPNGSAGQVQLAGSSGHDVLDNAALAAVKQWRFVPAKRGDEAIASWVQFPIVWKLK